MNQTRPWLRMTTPTVVLLVLLAAPAVYAQDSPNPAAGRNAGTATGVHAPAPRLSFLTRGLIDPVAEPPQQTPAAIAWRDGKLRITTETAYVEISSRVQVRFTQEMPDDDTMLAGTPGSGEGRGSFRIRRAKFKVEGWMHRPWLTYEMQVNYPAVTGSNAGAVLEDAAFDVDFTKGRGLFRLHVGQFKPPFGAQEMTSSGSQMFVDRALVSNSFFRGRETGVAAWGATPGNRFEWRVGAFNGNGPTRTANDNDRFQYNARLMWQPNGSQPLNGRAWVAGALYSESDFESTSAPIYAVAINVEQQDNFNATTGSDQKWVAYSIDGVFKFKGVAVNGMITTARRTPETGDTFNAAGGFIQAGKLFTRRRYEIGVRYGQFDPTDAAARNNVRELRGVFSYYYARHGLKWQTDVGQVETQTGAGPTARTFEVRSQLQFVF